MNITKRNLMKLAAAGVVAASMPSVLMAEAKTRIGIVAKLRIPWFDILERGIKDASKEEGVDGFMIAPPQADVAQQVRAIEDLIAQGVNVIGVIPNDGVALQPVFARAKKAGIKVITHEQPGLKDVDWDIELIDNKAFGEAHMEDLAQAMGGKGKYILFVGSLTVALHNEWADAAIAYQKAKNPEMEMLGDRFGVANVVEDSFRTATDQMRAHPDLGGIIIFGSSGTVGAARAVAEREAQDKVKVVGSFLPSQGADLMRKGIILRGYLWNPQDAGHAMVVLGKMLADGKEPTDGMDFPGLGKVSVDMKTRTVRANKMLDINPKTIDELAKLI